MNYNLIIFLLCIGINFSLQFSNIQNDPWNNGVIFFGLNENYKQINKTFSECTGFYNCTADFSIEFQELPELVWLLLQFIDENVPLELKENVSENSNIFNNGALIYSFDGSTKPILGTQQVCYNSTDCQTKIYGQYKNPQTVFCGFSLLPSKNYYTTMNFSFKESDKTI